MIVFIFPNLNLNLFYCKKLFYYISFIILCLYICVLIFFIFRNITENFNIYILYNLLFFVFYLNFIKILIFKFDFKFFLISNLQI